MLWHTVDYEKYMSLQALIVRPHWNLDLVGPIRLVEVLGPTDAQEFQVEASWHVHDCDYKIRQINVYEC